MKRSEAIPFSTVLAPIDASEFFDVYWEKKPLHISRSETYYFSNLLSIVSIETLLSSQDLYFPTIQLTQSNKNIDKRDYTDQENKILPHRLVQSYHTGATVVISQAHRQIASLAEISRNTQAAFQMRCQANVYLSPPSSQGFKAHFDTHDVLILQVSGTKTFNFYTGGIDLPFSRDTYNSALHTCGTRQEEAILQAGDTLYIPRGIMHDAVADDQEASLHITMGIYPVVMRDLLQEIIQIAAENNAQYRRSIPRKSWVQEDCVNEPVRDHAIELLRDALTIDRMNEAVSRLRDDVSTQSTQDCTGWLSNTNQADCLQLGSVISINGNCIMSIELRGNTLLLRTFGQIFEFSEPMASAVKWLIAEQTAQIDALPGLRNEQKLALGNQLVQEHLVNLVVQD